MATGLDECNVLNNRQYFEMMGGEILDFEEFFKELEVSLNK
ncbi:MAG: hypothetical protein SGI87_04205 [Flavobacteriales bacterium]|nr:hypothetical protein [Flavobacteriales bacterium]